MNTISVLNFARTLAGRFNNFSQAQSDPAKFSHINIFFRPFPWKSFQGPWFYSEQSYDYDRWRPYRQGVHHLVVREDYILMLNFGLENGLRYGGAGFNPELMIGMTRKELIPRPGCAMEFRSINERSYRGRIESGCRCLVPRDGHLTYLVSEVEFGENHWISRDQGFDLETHSYRWGSEHGSLNFTREENYGTHLDSNWLVDNSILSPKEMYS
ncbi:MAG: chorismate-binding protein [Cyanobacteria bacterium]|nr:chorismate-binding protein [Cyanobacteria bacterium bin.51]